MALNIYIEDTSAVTVPEDVAEELAGAYEALKELPASRVATVDFEDLDAPVDDKTHEQNVKAARLFVRQGKAWAEAQEPPLVFARKGDIKGLPTRVSFRIYVPRERNAEVADAA